ncbi:MarR family transcriptional regulator [Microbaculum marinum]|uniref:MarR family transcriptional regulator n=1 Tax=Microbaculum marinum TaxID=1764581 RepID=A0AAW9RNW2_9HYPH
MSEAARKLRDDKPAAESLTALDGLVGYRLRRLQGLFVAHWGRWFRRLEIGVTPVQGGILLLIGENPGLTQVALARLLRVEAPTLQQAISPLLEAGLVERTRSTSDGRAFALRLTQKGEETAGVIAEESRRHEADLLSGLNDQERGGLLALLEKALASGEGAVDGAG